MLSPFPSGEIKGNYRYCVTQHYSIMKDELIISLVILTMGIGLPLLIETVKGKEEPNMTPVIRQTFSKLTVTVIYDNYPAQATGFTTAWGICLRNSGNGEHYLILYRGRQRHLTGEYGEGRHCSGSD
jgi:hypothetical protein